MAKNKANKKTEKQKSRLTSQQEQFCLEYIATRNGTDAAIKAGYSPKTARQQASRLLSMPAVRERIIKLEDQMAERLCLNAEYITMRYMDVYNICSQKVKRKEWSTEKHAMVETDTEIMVDPKYALIALDKISERVGLNRKSGSDKKLKALFEVLSQEDEKNEN